MAKRFILTVEVVMKKRKAESKKEKKDLYKNNLLSNFWARSLVAMTSPRHVYGLGLETQNGEGREFESLRAHLVGARWLK